MNVTDSDKQSSLLRHGTNNFRKNFYDIGPRDQNFNLYKNVLLFCLFIKHHLILGGSGYSSDSYQIANFVLSLRLFENKIKNCICQNPLAYLKLCLSFSEK